MLDTAPDWWREFFFGPWTELHGSIRESGEREADAVVRMLDLPSGSSLLDVPCGRGRIALDLAARGYRLSGIDIHPGAVGIAQEEAKRRGLEVELRVGDMRSLPWHEEFDGAFNYFGSFGYFDDEGDRASLRAIHGALKPGGRLLLGSFHLLETLLPQFQPHGWHRYENGTLVLENRSYDLDRQRVETEWTFIHDGFAQGARSSIRLYSYRELRLILESCGFVEVAGYGTEGMDPLAHNSRRAWVVARKK